MYERRKSGTFARKQMTESVKTFGNTTSMHGVPWLISARSVKARTFWGLVCVIGMFMFIYMLVSLVMKYFDYPIVVKVDQVRTELLLLLLQFYEPYIV